jgi:hypothetical protein
VHSGRNKRGGGGPRFYGTISDQQGGATLWIGIASRIVDNDGSYSALGAAIQSSLHIYEIAVLHIFLDVNDILVHKVVIRVVCVAVAIIVY